MRFLPVVLVTAGFSACAQSASVAPPATEQPVRVQSADGYTVGEAQLRRETYTGEHDVALPRAVVWSSLPEVLQELGLPAPAEDPASATMAVAPYTVKGELGRERLSRYLECGHDITGPNADSHRVRLGVRTWLEAVDSSRTIVRTQVTAQASTVEGSGGTISCPSSGMLERRIVELLRTRGR